MMIDWLANNWQYVVFVIIGVFVIVYGLMTGKCIEWLKLATFEAEQYFGSGTGQLKLRKVYDAFIDKFPAFSMIVPFPLFSYWVDIALKWLEKQFECNANIKRLIEGE